MQRELVKTREGIELSVRPLGIFDEAFIYSSWIKSFRDSYVNACIPGREYYQRQKRIIQTILARGGSAGIVAVDPEDENHIYGYAIFELGELMGMLHYVYIKEAFRKLGFAHELLKIVKRLPREEFCFTHYPANRDLEYALIRRGITYEPMQGGKLQ